MQIRPEVDQTAHDQNISTGAKPILWLHIGAPKTGTTALQVAFEASASSMLKSGWLYPMAGRLGPGHHRLASAVRIRRDRDPRSEACFQQLRNEIARADAQHCLISSENFFLDVNVEALATHLAPFDVHILAYIRNQKNWLRSYFAQFIKHERYRFYDTAHDVHGILDWLSELADYFDRLQFFAQAFGRDRLIVRNYDEASIKRDVIRDVCTIVGIDPAAVDYERKYENAEVTGAIPVAGASNVSLNDDELEIVRLSNLIGLPTPERDRWLYELQEVALQRRDLDRSRMAKFTLGVDLPSNRAKLEVLRARNVSLLNKFSADRNGIADLVADPLGKPEPLDLLFAPARLELNTLVEVTAALAVRRSEFNANAFSALSTVHDSSIIEQRDLPSGSRPTKDHGAIRQIWSRLQRIAYRVAPRFAKLLTELKT